MKWFYVIPGNATDWCEDIEKDFIYNPMYFEIVLQGEQP